MFANVFKAHVMGVSLLACAILTPAIAHADVIGTSSTFQENSSGRSYLNTDTFYAGYYVPASARNQITGLQKFDPSLGTLTGVAVTIDFDYDHQITINAGPVTDAGAGHSVEAGWDAFRFYLRSSGNIVLGGGINAGSRVVSGNPGDEPAFGTFPLGSSTVTTSLTDITSQVNLADFTGLGDVDALEVAIYLPYSLHFTLDNVDSATATTSANQYAGSISLQYTYDPIPEPATFAMLAAGGMMMLRRRHCRGH